MRPRALRRRICCWPWLLHLLMLPLLGAGEDLELSAPACNPGPIPCPPSPCAVPCLAPLSEARTLAHNNASALCTQGGASVQGRLSAATLSHCSWRNVWSALNATERYEAKTDNALCQRHVQAVWDMDVNALAAACAFEEVLLRYDCGQMYSVCYTCQHCQASYRLWSCAMTIPWYPREGEWESVPLRPCRSFCQEVERQCPYFQPIDPVPKYPSQYAGEPAFLCRDPGIQETEGQFEMSPYGPPGCCYEPCHLTNDCTMPKCVHGSDSMVPCLSTNGEEGGVCRRTVQQQESASSGGTTSAMCNLVLVAGVVVMWLVTSSLVSLEFLVQIKGSNSAHLIKADSGPSGGSVFIRRKKRRTRKKAPMTIRRKCTEVLPYSANRRKHLLTGIPRSLILGARWRWRWKIIFPFSAAWWGCCRTTDPWCNARCLALS